MDTPNELPSRNKVRLILWITVGVILVVLLGWWLWKFKISADTNGPKILAIGAKTYLLDSYETIPVYVKDTTWYHEANPDKAQLLVDWGDGSSVLNAVPSSTAPLNILTNKQYAYLARVSHRYSKKGNFTVKITPTSSTGIKGSVTSIPVFVYQDKDTGSVNYKPSINKISEGYVALKEKEFNFRVVTLDYSDLDNKPTGVMDWGDGTKQDANEVANMPNTPYYALRFTNKKYTKAGTYTVTLTVKDKQGAAVTEQYVIIITDVNKAPYVNLYTTDKDMKTTVNLGEEARLMFNATDDDGSDLRGAVDWGDGTTEKFPFDWVKAGSEGNLFYVGGQYDQTRRIGYLRPNFITIGHFGSQVSNMPHHKYTKAGVYTAKINIEDSDGGKVAQPVTITVKGQDVTEIDETFPRPQDSSKPPTGWTVVGSNDFPYSDIKNPGRPYNKMFLYGDGSGTSRLAAGMLDYYVFGDTRYSAITKKFNSGKTYNFKDNTKVEFDFVIDGDQKESEVRFVLRNSKSANYVNSVGLAVGRSKTNNELLALKGVMLGSKNLSVTQELINPDDPNKKNVGQAMSVVANYHIIMEIKDDKLFITVEGIASNFKPTFTITKPANGTFDGFDSFAVTNLNDGRDKRVDPKQPSNVSLRGYIDNIKVTAKQ